ncbi:MAG: hypothetical protein OXC57_15560 [Rhodobacteraceae bacterium]|nr:hypothetical protein [Paracoccaceae bacterium]
MSASKGSDTELSASMVFAGLAACAVSSWATRRLDFQEVNNNHQTVQDIE